MSDLGSDPSATSVGDNSFEGVELHSQQMNLRGDLSQNHKTWQMYLEELLIRL